MKTYQNESEFVNNFAKDCKESIKSNGMYECEWNGVAVVVTSMDNNNASKVTMYQGTINGVAFKGNITTLKKRLNIAFTKEYNRTSEGARSANTRVVIKTDDELKETAKTAANRIKQAVEILTKYGQKYNLCLEQLTKGEWSYDTPSGQTLNVTVEQYILSCLFEQRSDVIKEKERKEAEKEAEKERIEKNVRYYTEQIAIATEKGDMDNVITFAKKLKEYKAALDKLTK